MLGENFGNLAIRILSRGPMALRPTLAGGLPLSVFKDPDCIYRLTCIYTLY